MRNILKGLLDPETYRFPSAEELGLEEESPPEAPVPLGILHSLADALGIALAIALVPGAHADFLLLRLGGGFMNMSARMAESIRDDLEITTNVRMKDVEDAQQRIVGIIRDLEEKNEIAALFTPRRSKMAFSLERSRLFMMPAT